MSVATPAPLPTSGASAPDLFEAGDGEIDARMRDDEADAPLVELPEEAGEPPRFADEFVQEQAAPAESRRPLEAEHETSAPNTFVSAPAMFGAVDPEPEIRDEAERSRLRILPVALGVVVGLLIGFGIGHFVGSRNREAAAVTATAANPPANQPGPATPQQAGQYSEQKVSPPAASAAVPSAGSDPSATPPPVPDETPAATSRKPAAPSAAPPARGRLVVTSTPSRAGVTVNGDWRGRTPLTLDSLPFGRYVIRVVLNGYDVSRHELTLSAREASQDVRARLTRTAGSGRAATPAPAPSAPPRTPAKPAGADSFTGTLYVDSRPRGATVFLDGRSVGQTPLSLPEVPIGAHVVRLELAGKRTWTASTRVVAGETARVTGSLEDKDQ